MPETEVLMPKMGESVIEATIIKWIKNEGDTVKTDETIIEIATDKVDSEIPAPSDGILIKKLCKEGEVVAVGKPICILSISNGKQEPAPLQPSTAILKDIKTPIIEQIKPTVSSVSSLPDEISSIPRIGISGRFYSPLVRNIAKREGITITELETIPGTGMLGRVTKTDILSYLPDRSEDKTISKSTILPASSEPTFSTPKKSNPVGANDEIIEMDRMRKLIAEHMVMSKHTSPHVTSMVEADVSAIVLWRDKVKSDFEKKEGEKLTYIPIFIEAVVKAIKDFPMINTSLDGTLIIRHKDINIGIAVALPSGNLIVPVIRNADRMNLLGLTKSVNDFANRARSNRLIPDDTQTGTFTITNVGSFGNIMGTPIINQPQAAILATGIIKKKPVVIENPSGDTIGIRSMMYLSLSYDHRIIDGMLGGSFLRRIADYLEAFDINRRI